MKNILVLEIPISMLSRNESMATIQKFLDEPRFHRIATVNPEFLILAEKDPAFKRSLQSADLCVADGAGIIWAGLMQGKKVTRFPGADLLREILRMAERDGHAVFLVIKKDGLSRYLDVYATLLKMFPRLQIDGMEVDIADCRLEIADSQIDSFKSQIINHKSRIILCNFGAPAQELFLEGLRNHPGDVRLAMGVGGAFDFLTGKQKRAPRCLRVIGLEWLWRLILQPSRFKRILNAVIFFPFLLIRSWQNEQKRL